MTEPASQTVELLDETWRAIAALCEGLTEAELLTPTDCPGWSVKDILSHILGTERTLRGETAPDVDAGGDHVKNDLGRFNEQWVESLRSSPGAEVLAEFRDVTAAQTRARRRLGAAEMDEVVFTPFGEMPLASWLDIRLFDCFSHEQDIRHALGRPGNLDGGAAARALHRGVAALPRAVGRAARGMPDGTRAQVVVEGDLGGSWEVEVTGGRGAMAEAAGSVDASLRADLDTFLRLLWGRVAVDHAESEGGLVVTGDTSLGRRIAAGLNVMP
jgi:uncharacterized protein (TIGR03083 family)